MESLVNLKMVSRILDINKLCIFSNDMWDDMTTVIVSLELIKLSGESNRTLIVSNRSWGEYESYSKQRLLKIPDNEFFDIIVIDGVPGRKSQSFEKLAKLCRTARRVIIIDNIPGADVLWGRIFLVDGGERLGATIDEFRVNYLWPFEVGPSGDVWKWGMLPGGKQAIFNKIKDICFKVPVPAQEPTQEQIQKAG